VNHSAISLIGKFFRLPRHDRWILLEATLSLAVASLVIAVLPFRQVGRLAGRSIGRPQPSPTARLRELKQIRWAIVVSAARVPWRAECFQQGLAAQFMLRRRGVPSMLHYGASLDNGSGLSAHVWVRDGDVDVIGGEIASRYAQLAAFPSQGCERRARDETINPFLKDADR
jgi:Transglutaminase-like superfamily